MDAPISICPGSRFYACPKLWSELKATDVTDVRFCSFCKKNVYLCRDQPTLDRHIKVLDCVCFVGLTERKDEQIFIGMPFDSDTQIYVIDDDDS